MIYILIFLLIITIPFLFLFLYLVLTEYKPQDIEDAIIYRKHKDKEFGDTISITSFNIGHCALDRRRNKSSKDFKITSGSHRESTFDNLISITSTIKEFDSDLFLLQEIDHDSARSEKIDQIEYVTTELKNHNVSFAYNFNANFIPFPITSPAGKTHSGLMNLSKFKSIRSERYQLDGVEKFPKSMVFMKRCLLISEYDLPRKKKLYVINVHFSSYDKDQLFRTKQFNDLFNYIEHLYDGKKNYIIVGGDFNFLMDKSKDKNENPSWLKPFPNELYESKFKPIFDSKIKTLKESDDQEFSIDGFIVSPNVKVVKCKTIDEKFEYSNHNPITMTFKL